jgi:hypothetical protein
VRIALFQEEKPRTSSKRVLCLNRYGQGLCAGSSKALGLPGPSIDDTQWFSATWPSTVVDMQHSAFNVWIALGLSAFAVGVLVSEFLMRQARKRLSGGQRTALASLEQEHRGRARNYVMAIVICMISIASYSSLNMPCHGHLITGIFLGGLGILALALAQPWIWTEAVPGSLQEYLSASRRSVLAVTIGLVICILVFAAQQLSSLAC